MTTYTPEQLAEISEISDQVARISVQAAANDSALRAIIADLKKLNDEAGR